MKHKNRVSIRPSERGTNPTLIIHEMPKKNVKLIISLYLLFTIDCIFPKIYISNLAGLTFTYSNAAVAVLND